MHIYEVLKRPLQTEKMMYLRDLRQYAFEVDERANKTQVKEAVETIFKVNVVAVHVMNQPAKRRRNPRSRAGGQEGAAEGQSAGLEEGHRDRAGRAQQIEMFEGV